MNIVIIGGVAGGMSAATRLRRLMETASITVIEKGPYVSFANCGLPYHISGEIPKREQLLVQTPEKIKKRFNIDVKVNTEATEIHPENKTITLESSNGIETLAYDRLILSTGAKPFIPPMDGFDQATNVFSLRNIPDLDNIMTYIQEYKPQKALVIGAGFIGLEMAETLSHRGLNVTIVEKAPHVLPPLDEEMAAFVLNELENHELTVKTNIAVTALNQKGREAVLEDGTKIPTDLIILAVGVEPESQLAKDADITLSSRGGILVDEHYQTNLPDIYAVGDAILVPHSITKEPVSIALASPANRQGRQVADVIAGIDRKNQGALGTAILRAFDLSAASTGLNERQLKQAGLDYSVVHMEGKNHAGYFPGAENIFLKLLFNPKKGTLYGAQGIGKDGVDKRIDILSTAIKSGLTVEDLPELEFTYAPPFGSAKDPVNMLGYIALNVIEGYIEMIQWHQLTKALDEGAYLIDVRTPGEFNQQRLSGAHNIPLDDLRQHLEELPKDKEIIITCHSGLRAYIGSRILHSHGFKTKVLDGSMLLYSTVRPKEIIK